MSKFTGLESRLDERHFTGLKSRLDERHTVFIKYEAGQFVASLQPEWRGNGTQTFDGILPRYYSSVRGAKISVAKMFGVGLVWEPIGQEDTLKGESPWR